MSPEFVFVDTPVFLHFEQIDHIDWCGILKEQPVTLLISTVVTDQLDRHKDQHPNRILRQRAKHCLHKLEKLFKNNSCCEIRPGVWIRLIARAPTVNLAQQGLDASSEDDCILGHLLSFLDQNPGAKVALVTSDASFRLKTRSHGLEALQLPDEYLLEVAADPVERENRELRQELMQLKHRVPKLSLRFAGDRAFAKFSLPRELQEEKVVKEQLAGLKAKFQPLDFPKPQPAKPGTSRKLSLDELLSHSGQVALEPMLSVDEAFIEIQGRRVRVSRDGVASYNTKLARFYQEMGAYFRKRIEHSNLRKRLITLDFEISNSGTSPADDVEVHLSIPLKFHLEEKDWLGSDLTAAKPEPPKVPEIQTALQQFKNHHYDVPHLADLASVLDVRTHALPVFDPFIPSISQGRLEYEVQYSLGKIKHGQTHQLNPLFLLFFSEDSICNFKIKYEVFADNLPQPIEGQLHVVVSSAPQ